MVSNTELNSRVESLSQEFDETKKMISELEVDMDEIKTGMWKLFSTQTDKEKITECGSNSIHQTLNAAPQVEHQPRDPRSADVDRGAKLEVSYYHGDHDPEVLFDWLQNLENFFRWYNLTEERKLFFAEAKLKRIARIWWTKYQ